MINYEKTITLFNLCSWCYALMSTQGFSQCSVLTGPHTENIFIILPVRALYALEEPCWKYYRVRVLTSFNASIRILEKFFFLCQLRISIPVLGGITLVIAQVGLEIPLPLCLPSLICLRAITKLFSQHELCRRHHFIPINYVGVCDYCSLCREYYSR